MLSAALATAFDALHDSAAAAAVNQAFTQVLAQVLQDQLTETPGCDVYAELLTREVQQLYETRYASAPQAAVLSGQSA